MRLYFKICIQIRALAILISALSKVAIRVMERGAQVVTCFGKVVQLLERYERAIAAATATTQAASGNFQTSSSSSAGVSCTGSGPSVHDRHHNSTSTKNNFIPAAGPGPTRAIFF